MDFAIERVKRSIDNLVLRVLYSIRLSNIIMGSLYVELLSFILISMTYLNAMEERGFFDGLWFRLLSRQFS